MIKIGDFARLSHVSVATLRHYDQMGLLLPIAVDSVTGYRYYAVAQLPRLNRIVALKDLASRWIRSSVCCKMASLWTSCEAC